MDSDENRLMVVKVTKNHNSLRITLPLHIYGLYGVKEGDFIRLRFQDIVIKAEKSK